MADFVFWWTMHALFWDGRISRDSEAPVAIQIFSRLFNAGMDVQRNVQESLFGRESVVEHPPQFNYDRQEGHHEDAYGTAFQQPEEKFNEVYYDADVVSEFDFKKKQGFSIPNLDLGGGGDLSGLPPENSERVIDTLDEVSFNGLFNFFANPEPSFRNLIMNTGFVSTTTLL